MNVDNGHVGLEIDDLVVRFGARVAVQGLSLRAPQGSIVGLIGPNGAGKSTTINSCAGTLNPAGGTIRLFGDDISNASPGARARAGLGRTFQRMELFASMTAADNVAVAQEAAAGGANPLRHIVGRRGQRAEIAERTAEALARCGISHLGDERVSRLSTGQRRLVELARVHAVGAPMLLLDEPSSGLDKSETEEFGAILRHMVEDLGRGILLVEHDMDLVMGICDYLYVLDFGQLIFEGTPREVRESSIVQAAYLGSSEVEEAVAEAVNA